MVVVVPRGRVMACGEGKQFFFEKKNRKTFATWAELIPGRPKPKYSKVFCVFFSKKKCFLSG
jgi:hypothetical protein